MAKRKTSKKLQVFEGDNLALLIGARPYCHQMNIGAERPRNEIKLKPYMENNEGQIKVKRLKIIVE